MPGTNFPFPQCGSCRRHKLSTYKIPNRKGIFYEEWINILNVLIKYRVKDDKMKEKIKAGTVWIYKRHFHKSDTEFGIGGNLIIKPD